jgi:hypothetical protein
MAFELHRLATKWAGTERPRFAELRGAPPPAAMLDFCASGLPFLPVVPLLMNSPTWGLRGSFIWELSGKVDGLIYVVEVYSHPVAFLLTAIVFFAAGWGLRHRAMQFHPVGCVLLVLGTLLYLALPRVMFDTYMADQRMPISLAFTLIACAHLNLRHDYVRRAFATLLVVLLAVRVFEVQTVWSDLSRSTASFSESVRHIERGAKVLVAYANPDDGDELQDLGLVHAACLAVIERSALVTTVFTVVGKQILRVRSDYRARVDTEDGTPPSVAQLLQVADKDEGERARYWERWTADHDYLYVLFTNADFQNPDSVHLTPVYAGERFVLYQINPGQIAAADQQPQN